MNEDRFRFRAVDEATGKIYQGDEFQIENYTPDGDEFWFNAFIMDGEDYVQLKLIQSTGLRDKNGVLIFQDDIIKNTNPESDAFNDISLVEWHNDLGGFAVIFQEIGQHKMLGTYGCLEVIGNVYQNKDLIE